MYVKNLYNIIGADFYTGVPDSQLKPLCNFLIKNYGTDSQHHIIAANEGNCTAIAAGYHLATGKIPVVYLQNSGEGNILNPVASLLNDKVYAIPVLFIIGWRGEPGIHDEPQHIFQGEITSKILKDMDVEYFVIDKETTESELIECMEKFRLLFKKGKCAALLVKKNSLTYDVSVEYSNKYQMTREEILKHIVAVTGEDVIVSTTGKASRELFEIRKALGQNHKYDFLTVGSMGHSSSIALGIALNKPHKKVWCVDGDGAMLMHMGAMAVIGANSPDNLVHIVINNGAHETVGGMPTVAENIDLPLIAKGCGYKYAVCLNSIDELERELNLAKQKNQLTFIEVKSAIGSRADLGRPTSTPAQNKKEFISFLSESCNGNGEQL